MFHTLPVRRLRRAGAALVAAGFLLAAMAPPALACNPCGPRQRPRVCRTCPPRRPLRNILRGIGALLSSVAVGIHIGNCLPPQVWRLPPPRPMPPPLPPIVVRPPPPRVAPPPIVVRPPAPPPIVVRPPAPPVVVVARPPCPRGHREPRGCDETCRRPGRGDRDRGHGGRGEYGPAGYDREGYDRPGYDRDGYDREGYDRPGYDRAGYDREGYDRDGYDRDGYDRDGADRRGQSRRPTRKGHDPSYDDLVHF